MKIEEKKKMAEKLMGWHTEDNENPMCFWEYHASFGEDVAIYEIAEWNPDTNHEQFAEVWNKLSEAQQKIVIIKCANNQLAFIHLMLNDLPKVIKAVMEVVL